MSAQAELAVVGIQCADLNGICPSCNVEIQFTDHVNHLHLVYLL